MSHPAAKVVGKERLLPLHLEGVIPVGQEDLG